MIAPEGFLSEPISRLREMIAASSAFQQWVNVADSQAALDRVHLIASQRKPPMPFSLIDLGEQFERNRALVLNARAFEPSCHLVAYFRDAVPEGFDEIDAAYAFTNRLGAVWADLELMAGQHGMLGITQISFSVPPTRIEADRRQYAGDYFEAALNLAIRL